MSDFEVEVARRRFHGAEYQPIEVSASGDTVIVTGETGKKIIVYSILIMAGAAVVAAWKSASTTVIGGCPLAANGGYHIESEYGVMECNEGENLVLNLGGTVSVGGVVSYVLVKP